MHRENYIETLRSELLDLVEEHLTPVALRYGYSEVPLESNIKWRPLVLVLGNYSSGKSTLINDFLGVKIQSTGQAPTDDSFTVITYGESESEAEDGIGVVAVSVFPPSRICGQPLTGCGRPCSIGCNLLSLVHAVSICSPGAERWASKPCPEMRRWPFL